MSQGKEISVSYQVLLCVDMASYIILFIVISVVTVCSGNTGNYLGCYLDNNGRTQLLTRFRFNGTTPTSCFDYCRTRSYSVAGLQYTDLCYCGDSVEGGLSVPKNECYIRCPSDETIKCGGEMRLSVFETGFKENVTEGKYLGCYLEPSTVSRLMRGAKEIFVGRLTNRICRHFCQTEGFAYSGTQSGTECFCSNKRPSYKSIVEDETCDNPCPGSPNEMCGGKLLLSIYGSSEGRDFNPVSSLYQGCYPGNAVGSQPLKSTNLLTTQYCVGYCYTKGYRFAGMKLGNQCYCDAKMVKVPSVDEGECNLSCRGDSFQKCGGHRHMSVYYTGIPEKHLTPEYYYVGCYSDSEQKMLNGASVQSKFVTPIGCVRFCFDKAYLMAGMESGDSCYCGDEVVEGAKIMEQACQMQCAGDTSQKCGGTWKISVYHTGFEEYHKSISTLCKTSDTLVDGKNVCKGDSVFNEEFDEDALENWSHVIKMPNEPDYPFVVFDQKKNNIFVKDGNLIIKPSLMDDEKVENGKIDFTNCTGLWNSEECTKIAMTYRILPPVESAMITTKESFTFLYGQVDIRAKLPRGDWLVPAIWLEPKRPSYGPYYRSGRMTVALARGNDELTCGPEVMGNTRLEAGIAASLNNDDPVKKMVSWESGENWSQRYHNYTLTWTPDNLTFSVDGVQLKTLLAEGQRIRDLFGSLNTTSWADSSRSPMAPFDTEVPTAGYPECLTKYHVFLVLRLMRFYITVGLYAGGMYDFGDECISGSQIKPWRNFEVKAMANFWQARQSWLKSWSDDDSALMIDSIKVTAV